MDSGLKRATVQGIRWTFIGQLGTQISKVLITLVLVRLLSPEEFGVIAMITVFSGVGKLLINFGFGQAIIQNQDLSEKDLSSIFWLNIFIGVFLAIALALAAPLIADFYAVAILTPLTLYIALTFVFDAANVVQSALLSKALKFSVLVKCSLAATVISGLVACGMAYHAYGVWSIATQLFSASLLLMLFIRASSEWMPMLYFKWSSVRKVVKVSSSLFTNSFFSYAVNNIDNLLIGKYFGQSSLGLYSKSFGIISMPPNIITRVLSQVMFPTFSKIQEQKDKIGRIYLDMTKLIGIISFPLMVYIAIFAEEFVLLVFGADWIAATPYIQVFCFSGILAAINTLLGSVIVSQGRSDLILKEALLKRPALLIGILAGLNWGILGIAVGKLVADLFNFGVTLSQIKSALDLSISKQLRTLGPVALATLVSGITILGLNYVVDTEASVIRSLLSLLIGFTVYAILIYRAESQLLNATKQRLTWRRD